MTGPSATGRSPCRSVPRGPITEYEAYGLTLVPPGEDIARLAETVDILKRMWTEDVFDFEGRHYRLRDCRVADRTRSATVGVCRPGMAAAPE
ncbi:LLM class flavin-dependent oxidoreductase [Streptomyces sp. NPDC005065]|uniref:LLM class flavin-dependent oxidoreductase n=1 Tax=Streptomyces sp. NPDC005065 TaxID=3154461 RepID=UPI0033B8E8E2